jgi:hypothetical protein
MTAAVEIAYIEIADPSKEVVTLEVTDGETWESRKFKTILAATVSGNEDVDAHINVTFSGATATINYAAQTDKDVTLTLYGRH